MQWLTKTKMIYTKHFNMIADAEISLIDGHERHEFGCVATGSFLNHRYQFISCHMIYIEKIPNVRLLTLFDYFKIVLMITIY